MAIDDYLSNTDVDMESAMGTTAMRERIHHLIDQLPERQLPDAEKYLAELRRRDDPFLRALANAPEDDEPLTAEDIAAIDEAYAEIATSGTISNEELWRRLKDAPAR